MRYTLQARAINARIHAERRKPVHAAKFLMIAVYGLVMAGSIYLGMHLPMNRERTYQAVQIHANGESDIVDYNLSATDCGQLVIVYSVVCELE